MLVIAQVSGQPVQDFLNSPLGKMCQKGSGVVAAVVIIYGLFRLVTQAAAGKAGAALRALLICAVVGGALIDLTVTAKLLSGGLNVAKGLIDQASAIAT
jgi:hypothetical protein